MESVVVVVGAVGLWKSVDSPEIPRNVGLENLVDKRGKTGWVVHVIHMMGCGTLVVHIFSSVNPQISVEKFPIIISYFGTLSQTLPRE